MSEALPRAEERGGRLCFRSRDTEETRSIARSLADAVVRSASSPALVISLAGELGAGKTVFVKGLAEGLGIDPASVSSPTYVIASQYAGPAGGVRLSHVDLYRLQSAAELELAGFYDLLEPGALVAVEWGDRFADALPADRLEVTLARQDAARQPDASSCDGRSLIAAATGPASARVLEYWRSRVVEASDPAAT